MEGEEYFALVLFTGSEHYCIVPSRRLEPSLGLKSLKAGPSFLTLGEEYWGTVFRAPWHHSAIVDPEDGNFLLGNPKTDEGESCSDEGADLFYCLVLATAPSEGNLQNFIRRCGIKAPSLKKIRVFASSVASKNKQTGQIEEVHTTENGDKAKCRVDKSTNERKITGPPAKPASLGFFELNVDGKLTTQNACENCNFRDLLSPKKEQMLGLLSDREQLLRYFGSKDVPSLFVLFFLSHGKEDGQISTDQWSAAHKDFIHFSTDDIFCSIEQLSGFDQCLKLINFGPCRGEVRDVKCDESYKSGGNNGSRDSCRITVNPDIHNLAIFYSTVETTISNIDRNTGSWFVEKFCDCLNQTEQKSLLEFLTMVQYQIHCASLGELGQTPQVRLCTQDRRFIITKAEIVKEHLTGAVNKVAGAGAEFYDWKSDAGKSIRGRQAFILYEGRMNPQVENLENALQQNLDFDIDGGVLSRKTLDSYFKKLFCLKSDVGCVFTCIFGKICENGEKELCVRVDNSEFPITDILHGFVGQKNETLIGKVKILVLVDEEHKQSDKSSKDFAFKKSATNYSGWLVLVFKEKELFQKLIDVLQCGELRGSKSLQALLEPLMVAHEATRNKIFLVSTLQFLLSFPNWSRAFVKPDFKLISSKTSRARNIAFDALMQKAMEEHNGSHLWLFSSVAGAGKSTVLKEIAYHFERFAHHKKVLLVPLKPHSLYIRKMSLVNEIEFLAHATHYSAEEIEGWIEQKRLVVLLDGFNEVCPDHRDKMIRLIRLLKNRRVAICVGTRPHEVRAIKEQVKRVVLIEIQPLNKEKQIEFCKVFADKGEEESRQFIHGFENKDILENPLHLSLLTQCAKERNVFRVYDNVVRQKVTLCLERKNDYQSVKADKVEIAFNRLQTVAFNFVMGDELVEQKDEEAVEKMNDFGVATVMDGNITFLHQTFAEFLATKKFVQDVQEDKNTGRFGPALFEKENLSQCIKFLDWFYSSLETDKDVYSLHKNALLTSIAAVDSSDFLEKVCEENLKQVFEMVKTCISFSEDQSALIRIKPNPEQFARSVESEEIAVQLVDMEIIDYSGLEKVLHVLLGEIEELNAISLFEKIKNKFPDWPRLINERCSSDTNVGAAAIRRDHGQLLDLLLQSGIRVTAEENESSLYLACKLGSVRCVEVLFKHGSRRPVCGKTLYDPLMLAVEFGHRELVKFLLGEKISGYKRDGKTLVLDGLEDTWNAFQYAVIYGHKEIATLLLSKSPALIEIKTKDGKSPLDLAVIFRRGEMISWLVREGKFSIYALIPKGEPKHWTENERSNYDHYLMLRGDVRSKEDDGKTALHLAAQHGYKKLFQDFLDSGADIEAKDNSGRNVVHYACLRVRNFQMIKFLVRKYTHLASETTKDGQNALHILADNFDSNHFGKAIKEALETILFTAIFLKESNDVLKLDNSGRSFVNIMNKNGTAEMLDEFDAFITTEQFHTKGKAELYFNIANKENNLAEIQKWIERGGDLSLRDAFGRTALHLVAEGETSAFFHTKTEIQADESAESKFLSACRMEKWDKVNLLLGRKLEINAQDKDGKTGLYYAVDAGNLDVATKLLNRGADLNILTKKGWNVLHLAVFNKNFVLVRELLARGARVEAEDAVGLTALHYAAWRSADLLPALLEHGAHVDSKSAKGWNALHYAARYNPESLHSLLESGADVSLATQEGLTALHFAASHTPGSVLKLLQHGAQVNAKTHRGFTALHFAIEEKAVEAAKALLEFGADVSLRGEDRWTALHFVVRFIPDLVPLILERGVDVNCRNRGGGTALHLAALSSPEAIHALIAHGADLELRSHEGWTALHMAAELNPTSVRLLLEHGADANATNQGKTALLLAAPFHAEAVGILLRHGADVKAKDQLGCTALHYATRFRPESIQLLLEHGVDVNAQDEVGRTALHNAIERHPEYVETLLEHGADANLATYKEGLTALHLAIRLRPEVVQTLLTYDADVNSKALDGWTALPFAVIYQPTVVQLLLDHGADVNVTSDKEGLTALHMATRLRPELVRALLTHGADVNLKDSMGCTALQYAVALTPTEVQLLLDHGADVNAKDNSGHAALYLAAEWKSPELVQRLLENGADAKAKNQEGFTTLHIAVLNCPESVKLLLDHGADVNAKSQNGLTPLHYAARSNPGLTEMLLERGADVQLKTKEGLTAFDIAADNHPQLMEMLRKFEPTSSKSCQNPPNQ